MKAARCALYLLSFFLLPFNATVQAQPDLSPETVQAVIGKVISLAGNGNGDGAALLDTITGSSGWGTYYFMSTVQYPGAPPAKVYRKENTWTGTTAAIKYSWECVLLTSGIKTAGSFIAEELKLINSINKILPGIFPDSVTHTWKLKNGMELSVHRTALDPVRQDMLTLSISVDKKITANKEENISRIVSGYNALIDQTPAGHLLQAYCKAAFFKVLVETNDPKEVAAIIHPLLKKVADKDGWQAFQVLMNIPATAPVATLTSSFTTAQKKMLNDYATGVITNFKNQQNGTGNIATYTNKKPAMIYNVKQLYKGRVSGKYLYIENFSFTTLKYTVRSCAWTTNRQGHYYMTCGGSNEEVTKDFLNEQDLGAISAGDCNTCGGSGITNTYTPYSYSITEKGIYNRYEISGSGYKTSKSNCSSCGGSGILEYYLHN